MGEPGKHRPAALVVFAAKQGFWRSPSADFLVLPYVLRDALEKDRNLGLDAGGHTGSIGGNESRVPYAGIPIRFLGIGPDPTFVPNPLKQNTPLHTGHCHASLAIEGLNSK